MHTLTKVTYSMAILTLSELDCYAFCLTQGIVLPEYALLLQNHNSLLIHIHTTIYM